MGEVREREGRVHIWEREREGERGEEERIEGSQ